MAYVVDARDDLAADDEGYERRRVVGQNLLGGVALACFMLTCASIVYTNMFAPSGDVVAPPPTVTVVTAKPAAPAETIVPKQPAAATPPTLFVAPSFDIALIAPRALGLPRTFAQSAPLKTALVPLPAPAPRQIAQPAAPQATQQATQQIAQNVTPSVPMPARRPRDIEPTRNPTIQAAAQRGKFALAAAESKPAPAEPTIWEKLFGKHETTGSTGSALAYAAPDGGVSNDGKSLAAPRAPNDGLTAVYDISAKTVYMPDGTRLEAHSGLREKLDDPRYVHVKMHGATPPHTYDLVPREKLFHGVPALRLIPVGGEGAIHGRAGLLAHTYMLGPNGDSNGCVSFKDYNAFLQAYLAGKVKRLVVVASGGRSMLASN